MKIREIQCLQYTPDLHGILELPSIPNPLPFMTVIDNLCAAGKYCKERRISPMYEF